MLFLLISWFFLSEKTGLVHVEVTLEDPLLKMIRTRTLLGFGNFLCRWLGLLLWLRWRAVKDGDAAVSSVTVHADRTICGDGGCTFGAGPEVLGPIKSFLGRACEGWS
jgi:hypothetical protein